MSVHDIKFPTDISYGSRGGPKFDVSIGELDSGAEERVGRWSAARWEFNAGYGVRTQDQLYEVYKFFLGRRGSLFGFLFKDWSDYASTATGKTHQPGDAAVDDEDQTIGTGDASETDFQLIKTYPDTVNPYVRNITRPINGTLVVALDGTPQTESTHYTVNYETGVISFVTAPGNLVVVTAGYEFDVPVRFGDNLTRQAFEQMISSFEEGSYPNIPLVEDRDEVLVTDLFWYGGGKHHDLSGNHALLWRDGRVQTIEHDQAGIDLGFPTVLDHVPRGAPHFIIRNVASNTITAKEGLAGPTITTITSNAVVEFFLGEDSGGNKKWYAF